MTFSEIFGLVSAGLAVYFYKKKSDAQEESKQEQEAHDDYVAALLDEKAKLEDKIDPNLNAYQSPVIFTATVRSGGQMLEQNEIILNCTNPTDIKIELSDFQAYIYICGYKADLCVPANLSSIKINPGATVSFRLYARYGKMFREYVQIKKALNMLYDGTNSSTMRADTFIPLSDVPVELDIQYLWEGSSFSDECFVYNVPGSFRWKYAGWSVGVKSGYNAADEKDQKKNPSHWADQKKLKENE